MTKYRSEISSGYHNRPLYITTLSTIKLTRRLVDPASSLNIMPRLMLEAVEIPRDRVVEQPMELSKQLFASMPHARSSSHLLL